MNLWTTGKRRAVFTLPGKGVGAGLGLPVSRSPGGAAAFKTSRVCFGKDIFGSNILLLFYKIKLDFLM